MCICACTTRLIWCAAEGSIIYTGGLGCFALGRYSCCKWLLLAQAMGWLLVCSCALPCAAYLCEEFCCMLPLPSLLSCWPG
jgi:hypothetical protein